MMLKRSTTESKPSAAARLVRAGLATLAAAGAVGLFATGCLDRPVVKAKPNTSNLFVDQIVQTAVDKIDLLFMIDNSVSMADKQEILKAAVPVLVGRLVSPICVDAAGKPTGASSTGGQCPPGKGAAEFSPIGDIHIGIVSSSLGGHGATVPGCGDVNEGNDRGRLVATMRTGITTWNSSGFLAWDVTGKSNVPAGTSNAADLNTSFQNLVGSVSEHGCGYEASLESWYRFLIDPEPPAQVTLTNQQTVRGSALTVNKDGTLGACTGCDDTLLAQRKQFLRPDSLVAIVMLSDENDCSIIDFNVGWFVGSSARMPLSTSVCATNPNDKCCRSCAQREGSPPSGCSALTDDATCKNIPAGQQYATWKNPPDSLNLRCYNQHQRFGFDLLYPTSRYVDALKNRTIALQSTGQAVTNPLYDSGTSGKAPRDPSLVFLAGIVGVPWQDIADDASLAGPGLTYLTSKELADSGRWQVLLGTPNPTDGSAPVPPTDPFMRETVDARSGVNPICAGNKCGVPDAKVSIQPPTSNDPKANIINGHEQNIPGYDDLQYACIFPLKTPKACTADNAACDCSPDKTGDTSTAVMTANSPLCQGGANINQQTSAKAYPGARELQVLKDFGDNAIVASICPKVTTATGSPESDPNYGYNPAVGAIIERLKEALKGKCLPRKLEPDATTGQVPCKVIEAQRTPVACDPAAGRGDADPLILKAVRDQLKATGQCGNGAQESCETWGQCEILQESDDNLAACRSNAQVSVPGYCYIDNNAELLAKCPVNQQQLLRFVDSVTTKTPAQGAVAFIACLGASIQEVPAAP